MSEVILDENKEVLFQCFPGRKIYKKKETTFNISLKEALVLVADGVGQIVEVPDPFADLAKEGQEEIAKKLAAEAEAKAKLTKSDAPIKDKKS